eukprot:428264_1
MMRNKLPISWIKTLSMIALFMVLGTGGGSALKARQNVHVFSTSTARGVAGRPNAKFAILGGGSFGLALSHVLSRNEVPCSVLVRSKEVVKKLNEEHEHPVYLKGIKQPLALKATVDPIEAMDGITHIIHAIPVQQSRKCLSSIAKFIPPDVPILSVSKGLELSTLCLMSDVLEQTCGKGRPTAFLSGPSFAREIALNLATAVVIASKDRRLALELAQLLSDDSFRCFVTDDVNGVEVGGAVKNVIALAAGMCEGLGLGTNALSALVTRGTTEMKRIAVLLGGRGHTLNGMAGIGDTFGTCFGPLSRNRNFGIRLGKGETVESILESATEVAEGVQTSHALADLVRQLDKGYKLELKYPIILGVSDVLHGKIQPREGLMGLMRAPLMREMYDYSHP